MSSKKQRNKTETSGEWRRRMMRETDGMGLPGDILAHLAADADANGLPPISTEVEYKTKPPAGATFVLCPIEGKNVDGMDPCDGCPGYGPECGALWTPPVRSASPSDLIDTLHGIFVGDSTGAHEDEGGGPS
jgi:hypothetical protein